MNTTDAGRRRPGAVTRLTALVFSTALSALGCTTSADAAADGEVASAADPVAISSFSEATYTSLVADRAGTLHAVWLDRNPESQRQAVYHRSTSDGGQTWGAPTFLSEGQPDGYTGIPTAVADGSGRVYAVWKMVDRGTSMSDKELRSSPAFGTLVYRVLENGRWSAVRSIGAERGVVAWFAATDPRGGAHVVWSENPDGSGMLTTTADARTVRQARLDGATPRGGRVISGPSASGKQGYLTLSGWVDGEGDAHWVAVRGGGADGRSVLVRKSDDGERVLPYDAAAAGERTPPQLVIAHDLEHLIYYEGGARPRIIDRALDIERAPVTIISGADAEAIQDFQVTSVDDQLVTTMQITGDDGNRLADLYVATLSGASWTKPVRVTDNANLTRQRGVTDADGRSLGTVKVWSTIHASAIPDRSGALHVLLSNRETNRLVDTRAGGMSGASAKSRAWFMTVAGATTGARASERQRASKPAAEETPDLAPFVGRVEPASGAGDGVEAVFKRYDVTEDGWLSGTELDACRCRNADANRDGEVTKAEYMAAASRAGGSSTRTATNGTSSSDVTREAERLFARFDVTEGGWLSGTELTACGCRADDTDGDGEVTKAEFVAAYVGRGGAARTPTNVGTTPTRTAPSSTASNVEERPSPVAPRTEPSGARGAVPTGKYNCYAYSAGRAMPWEPGFGGMAEVPRTSGQYVMNLTVNEGGNYQYLNRGRGTFAFNARTGMIDWRSGPFAGSGIKAAFGHRGDRRPVIYLDLEGTHAYCVGPQQ